jgi:hypothetical protein
VISNATLLRIDAPGTPTPTGDVTPAAAGPAIAVPCILDEPTFGTRRQISALQLLSTAVLYVQFCDLANAPTLLVDQGIVLVQQTGQAAVTYRIDNAVPLTFGGLSHVRCFVREQ